MSFVKQVDAKLEGAPDWILTVGLIVAGIVAWIVALAGRPALKVAVLAWMLAP